MAQADAEQLPALPGVDPNASYGPGEPAFGDSSAGVPKGGTGLPQSSDSFLKDAGVDTAAEGRAASAIAGAARTKLNDETSLDRTNNARMEQDRQRMDHAYQLEAAQANDPALKPWNADQERANRVRGPLEQFASVGTIFAFAASAFTKTPMVSALNAGAAAMNAIKQSDEAGYKSAYEAWKTNTDLALKRFDMERALYSDADKLMTTDIAAWKQKTEMIARQFDDHKTLAMAENGMIKEIADVRTAQAKAVEGLISSKERFEEFNWKHETYAEGYKAAVDKYKAEHNGQEPDKFTDFNFRTSTLQKVLAATRPPPLFGRTTASQDQTTRINERAQQLLDSGEVKDATEAHARAAREVQESDSKARAGGKEKIDQAIVNTLDVYPGMSKSDLGYISPTVQPKLIAALRDSPENLEAIAAYAKANPNSLGLIADASKRINLDAYQALFKSDPSGAAAQAKIAADRDAAIDKIAQEKHLDLTQAAQAKVMQKMLTTQAFTDAALAGSRGATIYLDKAFKEIYDPTSSPGAFFSILEKRYDEADRQAEKYKLGFDRRSPEALEKMPFWTGKAAGYAGTVVDKPPVAGAQKAADGSGWYVEATQSTPGARKGKDGKWHVKVQ